MQTYRQYLLQFSLENAKRLMFLYDPDTYPCIGLSPWPGHFISYPAGK